MELTIKEAIEQLSALRAHCEDMNRGYLEGEENPWERDVEALEMAIHTLTELDEFGDPHEWQVRRGINVIADFGKAMLKELAEEEAALRAKGVDPWAEMQRFWEENPDMTFAEFEEAFGS